MHICPTSVPPAIRGKHTDVPDEVTVLVNQTTQLDCHVDGNPIPQVTWYKDSQLISSEGPYKVLSNGRTLQVKNRKDELVKQQLRKTFEL